jgi:hypothetical protein
MNGNVKAIYLRMMSDKYHYSTKEVALLECRLFLKLLTKEYVSHDFRRRR